MSHTPGPWAIQEYGDEDAPALVIHKDSETRICFMATPGSHGDPLAGARRALDGDYTDLLLGDGVSVQLERLRAKGYGNAIVPQVAAEFIRAARP